MTHLDATFASYYCGAQGQLKAAIPLASRSFFPHHHPRSFLPSSIRDNVQDELQTTGKHQAPSGIKTFNLILRIVHRLELNINILLSCCVQIATLKI
jgi:hypothetical protein